MKTLGWIYLLGYLLDALFSLIATYQTQLAQLSSLFSMLMAGFGLLVGVMALVGVLRPRWMFLTLGGYYFLMMMFGTVAFVLFFIKKGPESVPRFELDLEALAKEFVWFQPIHLALLGIWVGLALYGMFVFSKKEEPIEACIVSQDPVS